MLTIFQNNPPIIFSLLILGLVGFSITGRFLLSQEQKLLWLEQIRGLQFDSFAIIISFLLVYSKHIYNQELANNISLLGYILIIVLLVLGFAQRFLRFKKAGFSALALFLSSISNLFLIAFVILALALARAQLFADGWVPISKLSLMPLMFSFFILFSAFNWRRDRSGLLEQEKLDLARLELKELASLERNYLLSYFLITAASFTVIIFLTKSLIGQIIGLLVFISLLVVLRFTFVKDKIQYLAAYNLPTDYIHRVEQSEKIRTVLFAGFLVLGPVLAWIGLL